VASESNLGRKVVGWVAVSRKCDLAVSLLGPKVRSLCRRMNGDGG
jgi:hypothetical protein